MTPFLWSLVVAAAFFAGVLFGALVSREQRIYRRARPYTRDIDLTETSRRR